MSFRSIKEEVQSRLESECGTLYGEDAEQVALVYPSPYRTGMSSLGYQSIYRTINQMPGRCAHRAFLPDDIQSYRSSHTPLFTYETQRPLGDYPVLAYSVAYETELAGVVETLRLAGIPPLAEDRHAGHPYVLAGGPLTFSNPLPLAPYVDAILLGEADESVEAALDIIFSSQRKHEISTNLAREVSSCYVPDIHGDHLPPLARCSDTLLPAYSQIVTPNTELSNMFLVEAERGCSRGCQYCVMRRGSRGGMRIVPVERILERIPSESKRVGLVGAAVSDHPKIAPIVETLADQGREVGLSSLRPDRLNDRFCAALRRAGYKTLTTASDGSSQRLRDAMQRKARERHLTRVAELAREHRFKRLKLYMMVGLPDEREEDIDELVRFSVGLSKQIPLSLGIAPFVSKRNTPLDNHPYAGIKTVERRLERLRKGVQGKVELRSTSARWGWVEWVLAQGGRAEGRAVLDAVLAGGAYKDWKRAFESIPLISKKRTLPMVG